MSLEPFSLGLKRPLETARGTISEREGFVVRIEPGGELGVGEATPLPGWTESLGACRNALERALDTGETNGWSDALAELHETPAARHGLALALADARARAAGVPLYRHLGGDRRVERVPVNATVGDASPEETASEACEAVKDGFGAIKLKVGARSVAADADRLRRVRNAVGEGVELRADANGAWTRPQARDALVAFEEIGVRYVEQPLPATDVTGHAALRHETDGGVRVALDETLAYRSVGSVLDADAADVLILKPMALGGPDRARTAAERARAAGVEAVLTTTIDGALARVGAVHVAASLPEPPACGLATADRFAEDLCDDPAPITDGHARVPQESGNVAPLPAPESATEHTSTTATPSSTATPSTTEER